MRLAVPLSALLLLSVTASGIEPRAVLGDRAEIVATPVPLDRADPARTRLGALTWLGGVILSSRDPAFGGFSSMRVAGDRFTLLSDGGNIVDFRMGPDMQPREARFADLPGPGTGAIENALEQRCLESPGCFERESATLDDRVGR